MSVLATLERMKHRLYGRTITTEESDALRRGLPGLVPDWLIRALEQYRLTKVRFDHQGDLIIAATWMEPSKILTEANECYPGIQAQKIGYIPFGRDDLGGGDYYYARFTESDDPPVFEFWHDSVDMADPEKCGREQIYPRLSQFLEETLVDR